MDEWISIKDKVPDHTEPVVYAKRKKERKVRWHVGIAYWTVSDKWNPEQESEFNPNGFTHWIPLPNPPEDD